MPLSLVRGRLSLPPLQLPLATWPKRTPRVPLLWHRVSLQSGLLRAPPVRPWQVLRLSPFVLSQQTQRRPRFRLARRLHNELQYLRSPLPRLLTLLLQFGASLLPALRLRPQA